MNIKQLIEEGLLRPLMAPEGLGGGEGDDNGSDDDFSSDDLSKIEEMQRQTPDQTSNADDNDAPAPKPKAKAPVKEEGDAEEGDEDDEEEAGDRNAKGQFVSKSALLRVKEKAKAERAAREAIEAEHNKLLGRTDLLTQIINGADPSALKNGAQPTQQQAPQNPWDEPDVDPSEDFIKAMDQLKRRTAYQRTEFVQKNQEETARSHEMGIVNGYVAAAQRIANEQVAKGEVVEINGKQMPVYAAAYQHLIAARDQQLAATALFNPQMADPAHRQAVIAEEERGIVHAAVMANKNPAEAMFALALAYGYQKPAPAQAPAAKRIEQVNGAMKATKSLSGAGGAANPGLTSKDIAKMSEDDFFALADSLSERQLAKLLGAD